MVKVYKECDASLDDLKGKTVAIIGYGNQGRSQALNLRDSGISVIVGSIADSSGKKAQEDGFKVFPIEETIEKADIFELLIPDEVQEKVYHSVLLPKFEKICVNGIFKTLVFAHGYNIRYGLIKPPNYLDVIMIAPRMIGKGVRDRYLEGSGAPAFLAIHQNPSGFALKTALALGKGIGATRVGLLEVTFEQETELDLFMEQATWPAITRAMLLSYETLVEKGFDPEVVALELYGSLEAAQIFQEMSEIGFFNQMKLHSQTSQFGTLSRGPRVISDDVLKREYQKSLDEIQNGSFAKEWKEDQENGYVRFKDLWKNALEHPINKSEKLSRELLHNKK